MEEVIHHLEAPADHRLATLLEVSSPSFPASLGDVLLVFRDGLEVPYYKSLLALHSPWWRDLLTEARECDTVILADQDREVFLGLDVGRLKTEKESHTNGDYSSTEQIFPPNVIENIDDTKEFEERPADEDHVQITKQITSVLPDFPWPPHINGPSFHTMYLRMGPKVKVVKISGNRSLFAVLSEKFPDLPQSAAFSLYDLVGTINLKHFINGQAKSDTLAFKLDASEQFETFRSLEKHKKNKLDRWRFNKVEVFYSDTVVNLSELIKSWSVALDQECVDGEEQKYDKDVVKWLQSTAPKVGEGRSVCVYCGHVCEQESAFNNLKVHMRRYHLYTTKVKTKISEYPKICSENKSIPTSCKICSKAMKTSKSLTRHMKEVHKIQGKVALVTCPICFTEVPSVPEHWKQVHTNKSKSCDQCGKSFRDPSGYMRHMTKHTKFPPGFCESCNKNYKNIRRHNLYNHTEIQRCGKHCEKTFATPASLKAHRMSVEGTLPKKQCPECHNFYVYLRNHIRHIHGKEKKTRGITKVAPFPMKKNLECKICGLKTNKLNIHIREEHLASLTKDLGILINFSTKDGNEKENLATIFVDKHSIQISNKEFQCQLCSTEFDTKIGMSAHMKKHFGFCTKRNIPKFDCPNCGQQVSNIGIKKHIRICKSIKSEGS